MKQTMVLDDWLPDQLANGSHGHWSQKRAKLRIATNQAYMGALRAGWEPVRTRARLTVVLVFPEHRRRDTDNLYARCKGLVDGLKRWFVDDDTDHLDLVVRAEVRRGVKQTEVTLEPADTEATLVAQGVVKSDHKLASPAAGETARGALPREASHDTGSV